MADTTQEIVPESTVTDPVATGEVNQIMESFEEAFGQDEPQATPDPKPDSKDTKEPEKESSSKPAEEDSKKPKDETPTEETPKSEKPADPQDDFDMSLLNLELKRFDEKKTLKEYLKENPQEVKEIFQKKWDYEARKKEFNEFRVAEKEKLDAEKKSLDLVVLRNMGLEVGMPLKTLEDFENDLRYDDAEEAFRLYQRDYADRVRPLVEGRRNAEEENIEMIDDFSREFKDVKVTDVFEELKPYMNASVAMGYVPFPKDALKVFYLGKNHEKLVEQAVAKAREEERKLIYKEIKATPSSTLNKLPAAQGQEKPLVDISGLPPMAQDFERAWN